MQSFFKAKGTVNRTKQQPTDWKKIFTNPTSDRGLISNIYKELKKLDSENQITLLKMGNIARPVIPALWEAEAGGYLSSRTAWSTE